MFTWIKKLFKKNKNEQPIIKVYVHEIGFVEPATAKINIMEESLKEVEKKGKEVSTKKKSSRKKRK